MADEDGQSMFQESSDGITADEVTVCSPEFFRVQKDDLESG